MEFLIFRYFLVVAVFVSSCPTIIIRWGIAAPTSTSKFIQQPSMGATCTKSRLIVWLLGTGYNILCTPSACTNLVFSRFGPWGRPCDLCCKCNTPHLIRFLLAIVSDRIRPFCNKVVSRLSIGIFNFGLTVGSGSWGPRIHGSILGRFGTVLFWLACW